MKLGSFLRFSSPSIALMLLLLALPMAMTLWLSTRHCTPQLELVTVEVTGPFPAQRVTTQRARLDALGRPVQDCRFVGLDYYRKVLGLPTAEERARAEAAAAAAAPAKAAAPGSPATPTAATTPAAAHNEFLAALGFTLLYVAATTPFILAGGLALALAMNRVTQRLRGAFIAASLLPFIITPVVGALAIKWLFRDNGLVAALLAQVGIQVFWMAEAWSARLLIIVYGIWHVLPFAFIVFYAGLQSVPQDSLEAARLDGCNAWQRLRWVTLPHLSPLVVFVLLIHLMDAYRVFEPVLVLTKGAFTTSVQYLTYFILLEENNPYKASAAAVLTLLGIGILLIPLLRRTWREQRGGGS
jgi:multiple sugar transport system permease protein